MIKNKSEVINKLFLNELKELIDKYNNIENETIYVVENIYNQIKDEDMKEYILKNTTKLSEIVAEYKKLDNLDIDKVVFFIWYNLNIEEINMSSSHNYYDELLEQKYTESESYIIYKDKNDLKEYVENELDYMLDMEYHIDRLFEKEILIDLWLNQTTKEELKKEMILNNDIEDMLELSPEYAFTLSNGEEYKYSYK